MYAAELPLDPSTWSLRGTLTAVFSFEVLFVLFLFAGRIKASPYMSWLPFDMTALFFVLSVIVAAFIGLTKKFNRRGFLIAAAMAAFVSWLVVSRLWTPGVIYAHQKSLYSVLAFWACAGAAVIIAADRARVRRFLIGVVLIAIWFAIEAMFAYATSDRRYFVDISGTGYKGLSDAVACGAVIAFTTLISLRRQPVFALMMAELLVLFFWVILVAGARQPLLGMTLVLFVAGVIGFRPAPGGIAYKRFQPAAWGIILAAVVALAALILSETTTQTIARFQTLLFQEGGGASAATRQEVWALAIQFWGSAPFFGHGVGSFPILYDWVGDSKVHPHNVVLEILSELGLVGLVLFGTFAYLALRQVELRRIREDPLFRCIFLLVVLQISAAMVSSDVSEHRMLYSMLGLLALPEPRPLRQSATARKAAPPRATRMSLGLRGHGRQRI
ncbi:MAG TPA: O-antigen ligase family protein [Geminicoccaceae bacterium]|nr:O-antigen ligase family protein [Geminicoccaceae bacterium]